MNKETQSVLFKSNDDSLSVKLGSNEEKILKRIKSNEKKYINVSAISKRDNPGYIGIARSTINSTIQNLINKGLIIRVGCNVFELTDFGKKVTSGDFTFKKSRLPARRNDLSVHKYQYILKIHNNDKYTPSRLNELGPIDVKQNPHKNFSYQWIARFDDFNIVVNKKSLFINIYDRIVDSALESSYENFLKAVDVCESVKKIGLIGSQISLHDSHFARVESLFAQYLYKIDNKFMIELDDGSKYWIDKSLGLAEEESDNPEAQDNAKSAMAAIVSGRVDLDDLPLVKHTVKQLVIHSAHTSSSLDQVSDKINAIVDVISASVKANSNTANGLKSIVSLFNKNMESNVRNEDFSENSRVDVPDYIS